MKRLAITLLSIVLFVGCGSQDENMQISCSSQAEFELCLAIGRLDDTSYGEGEFDALLTFDYYTAQQTPLGAIEKVTAFWMLGCRGPFAKLITLTVTFSNGESLEHYSGLGEEFTNQDLVPIADGIESEWKYELAGYCDTSS